MSNTSKSALKELIIDPPDDFPDDEKINPADTLKELEIILDPYEAAEENELEIFSEEDLLEEDLSEEEEEDPDAEEADEDDDSDPVDIPPVAVLPSPFGHTYTTVGELGNDLLEHIRKGKAADLTKLDRTLKGHQISNYLAAVGSFNPELQQVVYDIESAHHTADLTKQQRLLHLYRVAFLLADEKLFCTDTAKIANAAELSAHMKGLLDLSFSDLDKFCRKMVTTDGVLDPQLEAWLLAMGKEAELYAWRQQMLSPVQ